MSKKTLPPLHLACSDDELRPALQHIEIKKGIATATNAHILAQLNLSEYTDLDEETIKHEAIQDATVIAVEGDTLHYESGGVRADVDISCALKFPNHKTIVDAVAKSVFDKKSFVCFDPNWIKIAAKIFPSETLICRFYENNEMMVFFPSGDAKGFVGIMPMKISEEEAVLDFSLS